jgi:hypothetical protein
MVLPWVSFGSTFGCPAGGNSVLLPMIVSFLRGITGDNRRRREAFLRVRQLEPAS